MLLALERDRRFALACGLYLLTAVVNGLNGLDWTMGFCFPARFMVVALPALLLGLCRALEFLISKPAGLLLAVGAFAIGLDTVSTSLALPELGYRGRDLIARSIDTFYPVDAHFPLHESISPAALFFWLLLLAAIFLALYCRSRTRAAALLAAVFLPLLWSHSSSVTQRLGDALSPYMYLLPRDGKTFQAPLQTRYRLSEHYRSNTGTQLDDGHYLARQPDHQTGVLTSYHLPIMRPGVYTLLLPDLRVDGEAGTIFGHLVVTHRNTLPAAGKEEWRLSQSLRHGRAAAPWTFFFYIEETRLGHFYVEFSGHGEISLQARRLNYTPLRLYPRTTRVWRESGKAASPAEEGIFYGTPVYGLDEGRYKVAFNFAGTALSALFQPHPPPIVAAVYTGPSGSEEQGQWLKSQVTRWFEQKRSASPTIGQPDFIRPQVERVYSPWRILPFASNTCELIFTIGEKRDVWFLVQYDGREDIRLDGIELYRLNYEKLP